MKSRTHYHFIERLQPLRRWFLLAIPFLLIGILTPTTYASTGVPKIINYQGRLLDSNGNLLGGSSGTNYCYRFSIYDSASSGSKLWPSGSPATTTISVKSGVFDYGIGSGAGGGDSAITYNFNDSDTIYLNVEVANASGGACSASSLGWGGGRNVPTGLYTRFNSNPEPIS